ncbi:MAG: hypothetical protein NDI68_01270 [Arenimonas sp.]|nr:hypothetical protein [Arenimonas sp.]
MVTARKCLFLAAASLLLPACASTDSAGLAGSKATIDTDVAYVLAVEQKAKPAGVRVVWVHPPKRRSDD